MNLNDWRILFFSAGIFVFVIILLPIAWGFFPMNEEKFTSMAVLGNTTNSEGGLLEGNYFPEENSSLTQAPLPIHNITLGEVIKWNIVVYNHFDSAQYMMVKVKILDSQMSPPNNTLGTPSSGSTIYEVSKILAKNETTTIPFRWSILKASISGNGLTINQMSFNEKISDLDAALAKGDKLRLVFELWLYDINSNTFKFNAGSGVEPKIVWNQIWFGLT